MSAPIKDGCSVNALKALPPTGCRGRKIPRRGRKFPRRGRKFPRRGRKFPRRIGRMRIHALRIKLLPNGHILGSVKNTVFQVFVSRLLAISFSGKVKSFSRRKRTCSPLHQSLSFYAHSHAHNQLVFDGRHQQAHTLCGTCAE